MKLAELLKDGAVDERVLDLVIPNGVPLPDEDQFWDYKEQLPVLDISHSPKDSKELLDVELCKLIKDVIAFYNVNGGYLIIGVRDADKSITGWDQAFDAADLSKRIFGYTRESIDLKYRVVSYAQAKIGVLFIPERPTQKDPAQFVKAAPADAAGKRAFQANDIYLRARDECRRATSAEDYSVLFRRDRTIERSEKYKISYLENNLPARDPSLLDFVGREEQISDLWRWFTERHTAVKLLSGPGGVGKTSIAWAFCDSVSHFPPEGISKIVWLTAKRRTFAALLGEYVEIPHTHFSDLVSLLRSILAELGVPDAEAEELETRDDLIDAVISTVTSWPCLLVVDDVDSLPAEEQFDVFRSISTIFDRVIATGSSKARALLTARLTLGAAPGQLMMVPGMPLNDFEVYVRTTAAAVGAPLNVGPAWKNDVKRLHDASSGSPLFASSILRLISLGESLSSALRQYKGAEGEEVRRFAFERELDRLTDSQVRLLYAAIQLGDCTFLELLEVLQTNRTVVRDDIGSLRDYHLMALQSSVEDLARGTSRISVPAVIVSMSDIIRKKLTDPKRIETACARVRRDVGIHDSAAGRHIRQIISMWTHEEFERAVEIAQTATKNIPTSADLWCALGRSYMLRSRKGDLALADGAFRKAKELGCGRAELFPHWCEVKRALADWTGLIDLIKASAPKLGGQRLVALCTAYQALGDEQFRTGNADAAAKNYLAGAVEIREALENGRAYGHFEPLKNLKFDMATAYVNATIRTVERDAEKLRVWQAVRRITELEVFHKGQMYLGVRSLREWVESFRRRGADENLLERLLSEEASVRRLVKRISGRGAALDVLIGQIEEELQQMQRARRALT
jgi:hypothetical protein